MITCNRCGRQVPAGLASCQYCGQPLHSNSGGGTNPTQHMNPRLGTPDQPELPAWLESLRANERPVSPANGQPNFPSADAIDEGTLPSWMRSDRPEFVSNQHPALRPSSLSAPNTDSGSFAPKGFTAGSLIDEQSLPSWMQEKDGTPNSVPQSPLPRPAEGFSANELIDQQAMPPWMSNQGSAPSFSPGKQRPSGQPDQSMFAPGSQPAFGQTNQPPFGAGNQTPFGQGSQPVIGNTPPDNAQRGFPASSLLDMNTLPRWLQESGTQRPGTEAYPPAQPGQAPNSNITAASFVDVNALPEWLRSAAEPRPGGPQPVQPQGTTGNQQPVSFNVPPRAENVRVPNRPRGEKEAHEESEVAANVFASMLGVASVAPTVPVPSQQQPQGGNYGQLQPPQNWQAQAQPGMPPQQQGYMQGPPQATYPGQAPQSYMQAGYQGGYPTSQSGPQMPGTPQGTAAPGQKIQANSPNAKSNKRGFLDTIRGWFSH